MNHTIKGIIIVVAITSMLLLGAATTVPITQNSFAHKRSDFKGADPNTNTNTNSANSSSSSTATADNTNNIDNTATASSNQNQNACAIALTCSQGSTTVTPPPLDPCPHSPYTDFVAGTGCQDGALTCNPSTISGQTATVGPDGRCVASLPAGSTTTQLRAFINDCFGPNTPVPIAFASGPDNSAICIFGPIQTCPTPEGSTQTPTIVNGRCTIIQPGET